MRDREIRSIQLWLCKTNNHSYYKNMLSDNKKDRMTTSENHTDDQRIIGNNQTILKKLIN
jgi:hypothetical protein